MTTTIRVDDDIRDALKEFKNKMGMTYNGAISHLLANEPVPISNTPSTDLGAGIIHLWGENHASRDEHSGTLCLDISILQNGWVRATRPVVDDDDDHDTAYSMMFVPAYRIKSITEWDGDSGSGAASR